MYRFFTISSMTRGVRSNPQKIAIMPFVTFQIIIPMSGFGERFRRKGYDIPKPLIPVEGKPIIAHVLEMFPGEKNFILICNRDHLNNDQYRMEEVIRKHCPPVRIESIAPHERGPLHAVQQIESRIDPDAPTIVNYCDFSCYWNWPDFKQFVMDSRCAGAIPAYKGFHPHSLGKTHYAYLLESQGWVKGIREKQPWTDNRMDEFASSGTYYFADGKLMLEAFGTTVKKKLDVAGEYYVSLAYRHFIGNKLPVAVYPLQHFMQWGTPDDLEEYNYYSRVFKNLSKKHKSTKVVDGATVLPMAGMGKRFSDQGYSNPKPLICVSGRPMVLQAVGDLPSTRHRVFVLRKDLPKYDDIVGELKLQYPDALIKTLPEITPGQACTALEGVEALESSSTPLTIGACDNGVLYDSEKFHCLLQGKADVIVWGARGHPNALRFPRMFGWIDEEQGVVSRISVKEPLKCPETDPMVIGTFTFRRPYIFKECARRLIAKNGRINGEFYIDSCINDAIEMGLDCRLFEVDAFISWGTPDDLKTFQYWQSCFHKWKGHPYRLERDTHIPAEKVAELEKSCYQWP